MPDVVAAVADLRSQPDVNRVWAVGFGSGASLAICAATVDVTIMGVAALAAPAPPLHPAASPRIAYFASAACEHRSGTWEVRGAACEPITCGTVPEDHRGQRNVEHDFSGLQPGSLFFQETQFDFFKKRFCSLMLR